MTGQLTLDSEKSFGLSGVAATTDFFTAATASSQLQSVNNADVSSVAGANRTLAMVDSALAAVNGQRAKFGALQSRFESTVANLQTSSENLSASRSRIQDADFAAETANLTKAQILQQAGTALKFTCPHGLNDHSDPLQGRKFLIVLMCLKKPELSLRAPDGSLAKISIRQLMSQFPATPNKNQPFSLQI